MRSERLARHQLIRTLLVAVSPVPPVCVKTAIRDVADFIAQYEEGATYTREDLGRFLPPEKPA